MIPVFLCFLVSPDELAEVFGWVQSHQEGKISLAQVPYAFPFDHKRTVRTVIMVIIIRSVSTVHGRNTNAMHTWVAANVVTRTRTSKRVLRWGAYCLP